MCMMCEHVIDVCAEYAEPECMVCRKCLNNAEDLQRFVKSNMIAGDACGVKIRNICMGIGICKRLDPHLYSKCSSMTMCTKLSTNCKIHENVGTSWASESY